MNKLCLVRLCPGSTSLDQDTKHALDTWVIYIDDSFNEAGLGRGVS